MSEQLLPNCPNCAVPIDPMKLSWKCPVCSEKNINVTIFEVCNRCKFGPRLIECPACHEDFEGWLLMGNYIGKKMKIFSSENLSHLKHNTYRIGELDFQFTSRIKEKDLLKIGKKALQAIGATEFQSPVLLSRFLFHTILQDSKGIYWLHGWGYSSKEWPKESEEATIQISFRYPAESSNSVVDIKVIDVLLNV